MTKAVAQSYQRIAIVGCSGGGKSTLARRLAQQTGLPLIHLDQEYWLPGWQMPPDDVWRAKHAALIAGLAWIIEGSYPSTLAGRAAAADLVVMVDLPRWLCLCRVLWRVASSYGRVRRDMAPGCPERFDIEFLRYVWTFKARRGAQIEAALAGCDVVRLYSQREMTAWTNSLGSTRQ